MLWNFARCVLLSMACCACLLSAADKPEKMPKGYTGGSSEPVKSWTARTYDQVKALPGMYCIYIVDERKNNAHAFHMEGKEFIGSPEAKEALAKFTKLKIKATDAKGWPEAMAKEAEGGGTLVLMSGDKTRIFDKHTPQAELVPAALVAAALEIKAHQEALAKAALQHEKQVEKELAAKEALLKEKDKDQGKEMPKDLAAIPGLDPKKKDDPKNKKPDPKAPKPDDKKPVDPKDPKKKTPEDE